MRIIRTTDQNMIDQIHALDRKIFNDGSIYVEDLEGDMYYWYVKDDNGHMIAYSVAEKYDEKTIKGQRSAVISKYRGNGIQKKMIKKRHLFFKGYTHITYVHPQNPASVNSLISCGYKAYWPKDPYGGDDKIYLIHKPKGKK
jgi:predicted GNAT family acetyltransferase